MNESRKNGYCDLTFELCLVRASAIALNKKFAMTIHNLVENLVNLYSLLIFQNAQQIN